MTKALSKPDTYEKRGQLKILLWIVSLPHLMWLELSFQIVRCRSRQTSFCMIFFRDAAAWEGPARKQSQWEEVSFTSQCLSEGAARPPDHISFFVGLINISGTPDLWLGVKEVLVPISLIFLYIAHILVIQLPRQISLQVSAPPTVVNMIRMVNHQHFKPGDSTSFFSTLLPDHHSLPQENM